MLWDKRKYTVTPRAGKAAVTTDDLFGYVQQIIIRPKLSTAVWSGKILDGEGDEIYEVVDHEGTLNDRIGLPVGRSKQDRLHIQLYDLTDNVEFTILLTIQERR